MSQGLPQEDIPNQILIAETGVFTRKNFLDIASGSGNPATSSTIRINGEGSIILIDLTEDIVNSARDRAGKLNIDDMRYCAADRNSYISE